METWYDQDRPLHRTLCGVVPNTDGTRCALCLDELLHRGPPLPLWLRKRSRNQAVSSTLASHLRRRGVSQTLRSVNGAPLQLALLHHPRRGRLARPTRRCSRREGASCRPPRDRASPHAYTSSTTVCELVDTALASLTPRARCIGHPRGQGSICAARASPRI